MQQWLRETCSAQEAAALLAEASLLLLYIQLLYIRPHEKSMCGLFH